MHILKKISPRIHLWQRCSLLYPTPNASANAFGFTYKIYPKAQRHLHELATRAVTREPALRMYSCFVSSSVVAAFKFFIIFEQAAPCFYFALGSVYYVGPAQIQALPIVSLLLPWSKPRPHLVQKTWTSHVTSWSPLSVLHTEASVRLWNINQVLSVMCSRGFSSQVKLHPNPWPWPTSPAGHDLASGSFLSYHFPLGFFISTPSSLSSVLFFKHLSSFLPQDYSPYSPLCLAWHTPQISEWITLSLQCHLLRDVYRLPWTLCIS